MIVTLIAATDGDGVALSRDNSVVYNRRQVDVLAKT